MVEDIACCDEVAGYAGGSVATDRAFLARKASD
jgi:hypothetical protein